jgi:hypothetical protein
MLAYDYGTVRLFDTGTSLEAHFPKDDLVARNAVKKFRGRYDGNRRCWRIDYSGPADKERVAAGVKEDILATVAPAWKKALSRLEQIQCVTKRFVLVIGAGGVRIRIPSGHKHEYTLRDRVPLADKVGNNEWTIPASACGDASVKEIITDVITGDRQFYGKCVDYLEGFALSGRLKDMDPAMAALIAENTIVYGLPEFVHAVDDKLTREPVKHYAFLVREREDEEDGMRVDLLFLTHDRGYAAAEGIRQVGRPVVLDSNMVAGRWRRRRA